MKHTHPYSSHLIPSHNLGSWQLSLVPPIFPHHAAPTKSPQLGWMEAGFLRSKNDPQRSPISAAVLLALLKSKEPMACALSPDRHQLLDEAGRTSLEQRTAPVPPRMDMDGYGAGFPAGSAANFQEAKLVSIYLA